MKLFLKVISIVLLPLLVVTACSESPERQKATKESVTGDIQKTIGDATDNSELKSKGTKNQIKGGLRDTKEDVKEAITGE